MNRQQRKRRRKIRQICTTVILMLLTVVVFAAVLRLKTLSAFKGVYTRTVDMTDEAVLNAAGWLGETLGDEVDPDRIRDLLPEDMNVTIELSFERKGLKRGSYTEAVDEVSYSACRDRVYEAVCACLRELIIKRLTDAGYAENMTDEDADALINEALGMTLDNYIKNAGVELFPDKDGFAADINRAGDYRIKGNSIKWERAGNEVSERFVTDGRSVSFPEAGVLYRRGDK